MMFEELLDQAIAMLQRRGRVTYRTLKLQFQLDDETLEALKDELLYSQPQVVDDAGRGLIWTGETEGVQVTTSQTDQPEPQPVVGPDQPAHVQTPSIEASVPVAAERRQLTVMFCDLVGSTRLSGELDPEDLREVVRAYQAACTDVIKRYDGHVAQLLGDGLLVYFGYPQAHEDDAQRAVRAGLGILEAMGTLNSRLDQEKGVKLAVRVGIHTGLVVVGEMGTEGHHEQLALGETPNLAARLQGLAKPNTVVMSAATYRLTQGFFDCEPLGEHDLRGLAQLLAVYRVLGDSGMQSRLDVARTRGLTPLVGRDSELTLLLERWEQVKDGQGQVVLLSGEAGIGKSRLVQALRDRVAEGPHTWLECRSSPYFTNSALYPIIDVLHRVLRWQQDEMPEQRLEKLEHNLSQYRLPLAQSIPLFGALLSMPIPEDKYPPLNLTSQRQRQKTLEAIVAITLELAERQTVLFILEDLHWIDPTSLELLGLLIDQTPTASLYVLATCRPEFQPPWHHRSYLTEVPVKRLSQNQIIRMAIQVTGGKALPAEIMQQLVDKTDGVPLYVEEMTKAVLESGVVKAVDGHYALTGPVASLNIPATLQDSLMARLDRLVTSKAVAQYASVIGRQFSYELLQAVSQLDASMLQHELRRLVEAELLHQRGLPPQATYIFKHALIQDAAYQSLLKNSRQQYHQQIVQVLEAQFPETVSTQPEMLAHHCTEAGLGEQAMAYWLRSGERSRARSAHAEAIAYLTKGLDVLQTLPDTPSRAQKELDLQTTLGRALAIVRGHADPETEHAYARARELCRHGGDPARLFDVQVGLREFYLNRGELRTARELAEACLSLAQGRQDPASLMRAHFGLGSVLHGLGEFAQGRDHLEQAIALYTPHQDRSLTGQAPLGVPCLARLASTLWQLGYPMQALTRSREMLDLAQELSDAYNLVRALCNAADFHHLLRDGATVQERAETSLSLSTEQVFAQWVGAGIFWRGWGLAAQGHGEEGIAEMRKGLGTRRTTGSVGTRPTWLALLAEAHGWVGQVEEGLYLLAEALALVKETETRSYAAEMYRLRGELLLTGAAENHGEADSCFQQAFDMAHHQQAKSWELRAATSLARLWQSQDKRQEAYALLAPVYGWFTEGFDTADLKDAKALLDELS